LSGYFSKAFLERNQLLVQAMAKQMAQAAATKGSFLVNAKRQMDAMRGFDALPILGNIKSSTLILHGEEDAVVPIEAGRLLARKIPGSRFVEVKGAGHLLVAEASRTLYEETASYLA
jgi:3-oxoadipate enol-lactonase